MSRRSHVTACFVTTEWGLIGDSVREFSSLPSGYLEAPGGVREAWHPYLKSIADLFKATLYESWQLPSSYHKIGYSSIILGAYQHFGLGVDITYI
ncbi:hypothetical protein [Shewanella sp. SR44-3]|uniref:hypothetical protein n=2 Tax=Shewanella TaxID=22 RepID=UPI0015FA4893|nr:hypothetical protein [Shewanella sp. SR44-3]MBB1270769.1 hypothetical protein [Shewanella sp. SR44-3]